MLRTNQRKPVEKCSGPENENASISLGKYNTNAKEFSTAFEHLDRSRRPHRSNRRRKIDFRFCTKINADAKKMYGAPAEKLCWNVHSFALSKKPCKSLMNMNIVSGQPAQPSPAQPAGSTVLRHFAASIEVLKNGRKFRSVCVVFA